MFCYADNSVFSHPSIRPSNIVVDAVSLSLLKGSLIDFATELIGSSFRVVENPQVCSIMYQSPKTYLHDLHRQRAVDAVVESAGS